MLRGAGRQTKLGTVQVGSRMPFDCQGRIAVLYSNFALAWASDFHFTWSACPPV